MLQILAIIYFVALFFLARKNFRLAVILLIFSLPAYLIRFNFGPLPSTVLELTFGAVALAWLVTYSRQDWKSIAAMGKKHKVFSVAFGLFFLSPIISVLISDLPILSLGVWRAYFLEPMALFVILIGRKDDIKTIDLILGLAMSTFSISIYAIVQKFTGWGIATPEFAVAATRRVTAFFSSPNAVGLYLAPVLMLTVSAAIKKLKKQSRDLKFWLLAAASALSLAAIIFTKSQGAWIGLAVGLLVFLFFLDYKKIVIATAILGIIFSLLVPSMRQALLFQDQAGQNRLRLMSYTKIFLTKSPQNFVLGTGLGEFFRKVQKPYYNDKIMERLIFPHNIFLNFWTETGLLGLLSITTILGYVFYLASRIRKNSKLVGAGLMSVLTVLVVHGLVDVPYFKNDLAFLFWIIIALFIYCENIYKSKTDVV